MLMSRGAATFTIGLLVVALAGCVTGPPQEAVVSCYLETLHYGDVLPEGELRPAFEARGYTWGEHVNGEGRITTLEPPSDMATAVIGVVSFEPGISSIGPGSSNGTVMTFQQSADVPGGQTNVHMVAADAASVVNGTLAPDVPEIERWVTGSRSDGGCPVSSQA